MVFLQRNLPAYAVKLGMREIMLLLGMGMIRSASYGAPYFHPVANASL